MKKHINSFFADITLSTNSIIQIISWRHPIKTFSQITNHFASDSLYRNSIYLILSTTIVAFFGFFFWIISARLYSAEQVGIATTLISVITLIASISNFGINSGLVRYLPTSKNKNELINSSFLICSITAIIISIIFLIGLQIFSPVLLFLRENIFYFISFILFVIALSINLILESLFVAYRSAKFVLIKNSVISITKLILVVIFIVYADYGIFLATGFSYIMAIVISIFILVKFFNFNIQIKQNFDEIKKISIFSFGNYIAGFTLSLPALILPIIITNQLGAQETAYFYIAMMIATLIFMIPYATTQSLFAEGSQSQQEMKIHIIKSIKLTALVLTPIILVTVFFGNFILLAFGKKYSSEAFSLLQLLALSSIPLSINSLLGIVLKIKNQIKELIAICIVTSLLTFFLCYLFINSNLIGIGFAWLISQIVVIPLYIFIIYKKK